MQIAHVSTFAPLKCGIAIFASDLIDALPPSVNDRYALHYGDTCTTAVKGEANVNVPSEIASLGRTISKSGCDVVALQHEFGIWGGNDGENLVPFLENLDKPLVSVLHTTFGPQVRPERQFRLLERLIDSSHRVVLLTETARRTAETLLGRSVRHASVIPHGVPIFPYRDTPPLHEVGKRTPLRLITPGFFRPNKGIEIALRSIELLVNAGFDITYEIVGQSQTQFPGQRSYEEYILRLADYLGLHQRVFFDSRFLPVEEQIAAVQRSHAGVFAYQDPAQSSSGTVPLVLSAGRPAVCTPFEYARSKFLEGHSVVVSDGYGVHDVAGAIERLLEVPYFNEYCSSAYVRCLEWEWKSIGARFMEEFRLAMQS